MRAGYAFETLPIPASLPASPLSIRTATPLNRRLYAKRSEYFRPTAFASLRNVSAEPSSSTK